MTAFSFRRLCRVVILWLVIATAATAQTAVDNNGDAFTLNLKDADIKTLIATVSEVTGRNFVVDPRVKGDVTVPCCRVSR